MKLLTWLSFSALPRISFRRLLPFNLFPLMRRFPALRWPAVATLCCGGMLASAQTAHFSGAQTTVGGGGTNILAIAVDAKGDVFFTTQNPFVGLIADSKGRRRAQYEPAALRSPGTQHFSDGPRPATAQKKNASGCTYQGAGSGLFVRLANTGAIYSLSGLDAPYGLAVDSAGDLYVLDAYSGNIYKYAAANGTVVVTGAPSFVALAQGDNCTGGDMAMDAQGDLYYTSPASNEVEEITAVNGVIPQSASSQSLGSGYDLPAGIAVDSSGDVFVASAENNAVEELVAVNGSIPASPTIRTLGSGFNLPAAVAVDSSGDVYVSDLNNNELKEILAVNGSIPSSPTINILGSFSETETVALDGSGDIFTGESGSNTGQVIELTASTNFGQVNVGSTFSPIGMSFTFDSGGSLGGISVLTLGATGLDYTNAGSGTCNTKTAYSAGQSCTVNVSFAPKFSGTRDGAVVLTASTGDAIATGYVQGVGVGPQVNFLPGTQSTVVATGLANPTEVAVDGSGNVYLIDTGHDRVLKETLSAGAYTQSIVTSDLSIAYGLAIDGSGAVYVADSGNDRVLKETPTASGYSESTIASGVVFPTAVVVDGSGSVYISDSGAGLIKETLIAGNYTQSTIITGVSPYGLAVDGSGNLYVADPNAGALKETLSGGVYTQSTLPWTGQYGPTGIAVDGGGNVYIAGSFSILKDTLSAGSYTPSALVSDFNEPGGPNNSAGPYGVAVDSGGNLYVSDQGNNRVLKEDFADPPTLTFADTAVGTTSADSPQAVTVENNGNAALSFPITASGSNPNIGPDFTLTSLGQADCPVLTSESTSPATLAADASCEIGVSFTPTVSGPLAESIVLTDTNLNAAAPTYAAQSISLMNGATTGASFVLAASAASLNVNAGGTSTATITVIGQNGFASNVSFSASGLPSGVTASFSPNPTTGTSMLTLSASSTAPFASNQPIAIVGTSGALTASLALYLTVIPAPEFSVSASPAYLNVVGGSTGSVVITTAALNGYNSAISLSTCNPPIIGVSVTFTPSTIPAPGNGTSTMTVAVGPNAAVGSDEICLQADGVGFTDAVTFWLYVRTLPVITWPVPSAITYGTPLSATQLDATATVPGTFVYSPAASTALGAGTQTLTVTFTPTDTTDYMTATGSVTLTVNKATATANWATPAAIVYGTPLGATQLDASASTPGSFVYSPATGSVLTVGTHTLAANFTPTDAADYTTASASVVLTVTQATPAITWPTPAPIPYGTPLSATQLDATANVPGTFSYLYPIGQVFPIGATTLSVIFTPADTTDYTTATASVVLTVTQITPIITWATPAPINYGTKLSATQLDATANTGGTFKYSPASGTLLTAGPQTLTVTFTPSLKNLYTTATATVVLIVNQVTPVITWATPAAINYGTALSSKQLDAKASVAGTFVYSPAAGTVAALGTDLLSVTFTPTNSANYATVTSTVELTVNPAPGFTLSASPASVAVTAGSSATTTIAVMPTNGFTGSVKLTTQGLPSGVTASYSGNPATSTSVLTLKASKTATIGSTTVTVTGTSGSLVETATIQLNVAGK